MVNPSAYDPLPTAALVEIAGRVVDDDTLYARFRQRLNERIDDHVALTPAERADGIGELREACRTKQGRGVDLCGLAAEPTGCGCLCWPARSVYAFLRAYC